MMAPKAYSGIMVSSTFADLEDIRQAVISAIEKLGYHATVMENSGGQAETDVIDTSLAMVHDAAAVISVIGYRYGQSPECKDRNPDKLSVSELEFNEAMRLERPILLFIMGDDYEIKHTNIELDPDKREKLFAFRQRAKKMSQGSEVERIYEVFNSREEFKQNAAIAVGNLSRILSPHSEAPDAQHQKQSDDKIKINVPPHLRAVPRYLGSHDFVGRAAELNTLDDWCASADPNPMLLFEAIGGTGKSMVTWTWLNNRAVVKRSDWAGRFWFSFYEGGATMSRFCREALAYMTGVPVEKLVKKKMYELMPMLVAELEARPWLLVLDGLERILVAYHRIDAPQMRDEDIDHAEDQIANRDPRAAINPADEELLHRLTACAPSKLLITSRLTPQALINRSDMPIPGVRRELLPGLRPTDAEQLSRACGMTGASQAIQDYLQRNCDCHPLVIGALAGLVNNYLPDRGNFDAWLADPEAGGKLALSDLDLVQRRNHILDAAIEALADPAKRLLKTMSLLQGGADYVTLKEFNPHLPPAPQKPKDPEDDVLNWYGKSEEEQRIAKTDYDEASAKYHEAYKAWEQSSEVRTAGSRFDETLKQLEQRGLLQYERNQKQYDLHPVVRGVASGRMNDTELGELGERVVDYFSARPSDQFENADTLADLEAGIQTVTTLTRIGEFDRAVAALKGSLGNALVFNLMAYDEMLRLIRPFFPDGWNGSAEVNGFGDLTWLLAVLILLKDDADGHKLRDNTDTLRLMTRKLCLDLSKQDVTNTARSLQSMSVLLYRRRRFRSVLRVSDLALSFAEAMNRGEDIFSSLFDKYRLAAALGDNDQANRLWAKLDPMGRDWPREIYRSGQAEVSRAEDLFWRGELTEILLAEAESFARENRSRETLCSCLILRGEWQLSLGNPENAINALNEAIRLYHEFGPKNLLADTLLVLAKIKSRRSVDAHDFAERLSEEVNSRIGIHVARIWSELGEKKRAIDAALRAHRGASSDGEPYVFRYYLDQSDALLRELGETPPDVPLYDPANDEIFEWEDDVKALIENTRKERDEWERKLARRKKLKAKKN